MVSQESLEHTHIKLCAVVLLAVFNSFHWSLFYLILGAFLADSGCCLNRNKLEVKAISPSEVKHQNRLGFRLCLGIRTLIMFIQR